MKNDSIYFWKFLGVETPFDTSKNQKNQMESTKIKKIKRNQKNF
jgi:hypothetical protein